MKKPKKIRSKKPKYTPEEAKIAKLLRTKAGRDALAELFVEAYNYWVNEPSPQLTVSVSVSSDPK